MKFNLLTTTILASTVALFATSANAGVTKDSHGNVGYDTYDECVAAVKSGTAKFYQPYTHQKPKYWKGETSVKQMTLAQVTIPSAVASDMPLRTSEYTAGACDVGVGQSHGRYGVSGELVGKYVPYSPNMPVNVYMNQAGVPVRVTMQQCDNHFGGKFPTPVISELKAPPAQLKIDETRNMEVVTTEVKRTIRPSSYRVKEVIIAPKDQVERVQYRDGQKVIIQDGKNSAFVVGREADREALDNIKQGDQEIPVILVPDVDGE